ncbi:uncharacterized protein LOC111706212 [Eurytemora carolleeae]|uniref:uncharacterized protein LOC111706212 n=1 Tax=Eurytemora carolleeae TaxID=1294199 RepID=UPI000C77EB4B|nr:uncharacterized protein LOC111706212 [Eurytemora carolleeae]|eukprot:XP_023334789.1 uncharacterized protein LOC111706212 [Eurytemora affinis]
MDSNLEIWKLHLQAAEGILSGLPRQMFQGLAYNRTEQGTARSGGGCTDPFSIFSFLAFALAVGNFIMNMNGRKKRSIYDCSSLNEATIHENTVLASYSILRSALNSVGVDDWCMKKFMCEGGREARKYGKVGRIVGEGGGETLGSWRKHSLLQGLNGENCGVLYSECSNYPPHYRTPEVEDPDSLVEDTSAVSHPDLDFNSSTSLVSVMLAELRKSKDFLFAVNQVIKEI